MQTLIPKFIAEQIERNNVQGSLQAASLFPEVFCAGC